MDIKVFYCVFCILLLTMTVPSLCADAPAHEKTDKRFIVNHPCASGRGSCRPACLAGEHITYVDSAVCGTDHCCVV
ncbi:hypothetical protein DPMN_114470 [Dreissena polymorpha]|uniref:Beta-defensin n=1 Tax=Dreissena polymorpha TaxID=45954 RepID=A0A9D4KJY1_DREPO|nr:hypothetical protein DPMN_114470 [Dreissena polymorpha]